MEPLRTRGKSSRTTAVLFLATAAVSVAALFWMGIRLIAQDRELEAERLRERREAAADRLAVSLEQVLSAEEKKLGDLERIDLPTSDEDSVFVAMDAAGFRAWPENALLFFPVVPGAKEPPASSFAEAEKWEFIVRDYDRAAKALLPYAKAKDPAVRIGAQLRLARNFRKAGNLAAALETYGQMAQSASEGVSISGTPADLAARRARGVLLQELGRTADLRREARSLADDLKTGRWRLDRASYIYYRDQAALWLGDEPRSADPVKEALAEAAAWLWENVLVSQDPAGDAAGRRTLRPAGTSVTVLWRQSKGQLTALVAGPRYQQTRWFDPLVGRLDREGIRVAIRDFERVLVYGKDPPVDGPLTSRLASATGLPWDLVVVNADRDADRNQFAQRRRLMIGGLAMVALLVIAATYLIGRAVSRELAAARLQADFVSAVSHEFRTPLTSMRQFTEMLIEDDRLPLEKRRAFYCAQERATRRLTRLVESLLDFGRMEAGAKPYRLERLDAGQLVGATVEEFKGEAGSDSLEMECVVPAEGPMVKADGDALSQALWNLLDNAVKYSADKAVVRVEVEPGAMVAIRVRDRGIGIPSSEKDRIFRKFVRGSGAQARGVKGTGIGLAMVKHIVDAHGGRIRVESEPGKGSTFTILLPSED
jgi:signal transduction histidine kinase